MKGSDRHAQEIRCVKNRLIGMASRGSRSADGGSLNIGSDKDFDSIPPCYESSRKVAVDDEALSVYNDTSGGKNSLSQSASAVAAAQKKLPPVVSTDTTTNKRPYNNNKKNRNIVVSNEKPTIGSKGGGGGGGSGSNSTAN